MLQRLHIEPGEGRVFAWGVATLALVGCADVLVKNVSETFFLKRVGVEYLPQAYLFNSVLLVGSTYLAGRIAARSNRPRMLPIVLLSLSLTLIPLWLLVRADIISAFVLLVIASKQFQSIALLTYWQAMGDLLHGRQAKRLFAPMMAGYTLGAIFGSFGSGPIGRTLGAEALLPFAAGAFALSGVMALPLRRLVPMRLERGATARPSPSAAKSSEPPATFRSLWAENQLFRLLFVAAAASGLVGPMLYFQFQYVTDLATAGADAEGRLLDFYSQFRGWINVVVLGTQLTVASNLYRRIGIPLSVALSPVIYLVGFLGMSVQFSLRVGSGAFAAIKVQDGAVYDPAARILFNLFPERIRPTAMSFLEGPVKRAGGAVGNILSLGVVQVASAAAVGFAAIPITIVWLWSSIALWRSYPALLLRASTRRARHGDDLDISEMIDPNTLRELSAHLVDDDPRAAIELISEGPRAEAAGALAAAARKAPAATRSQLVAALDRLLEKSVAEPVTNLAAAADLEALLADGSALEERDRADVIQAYGRLTAGDAAESLAVLENAAADPSPGVRLVAAAALARRGQGRDPGDLDAALRRGIASEDAIERRVAREELRAELLCSEPGAEWEARLLLLAQLLERESDRAEAAEAIADAALAHGAAAAAAGAAMIAQRDTADPRVKAAVLRFCGCAGLADQASWLVEHVAADGGAHASAIRAAARSGLIALGSDAADLLLVELSFGKRRTRDAILPIIREIEVEEKTLHGLYERELDSIRRKLVHRFALRGEPAAAIVQQRLGERTDEGLHTALLLLAAIHNEDRIAELGHLLKLAAGGGSTAILLEALDALLGPQQKTQLMPLMGDRGLELRARSAASALGVEVPSAEQATAALLEESDELTRILAAATLPGAERLALPPDVKDHADVLSPVEIVLHLTSLPLFEALTTRQLMDLAGEVSEREYPAGATVFREGDSDDCLYLIVDGTVRVTTGETLLAELGSKSFFGEIAVLEGGVRTATVSTVSHVRLLQLDRNDLLRLMEELPAIAIGICQTLSKRVRELTDRVRPEV